MNQFVDFSGKTIVIAGASSGIGKRTAKILNDYGARVILLARREEKLQEVITELSGTDNRYYVADLALTDQIEPLAKQIKEECGPIDGLVYTSGIANSRPLKMAKPEYVESMMRINFFGFYEMVRAFTKKGFYNPNFSIVGISSCASTDAGKGQSIYSASKAAMDGAVRVMAQELADKDIRINTVRPGMVKTEMYELFLSNHDEESNTTLVNRQFLGIGETDDIANAIAFLLSPLSKFTTGAHFAIDGGYTCH